MFNGRRTIDRRRRVLYSAHQAEQQPATAASRREAARLREARCPPAAYGSRVHRRLRARWFSLVPVKRRTMLAVSALLTVVAVTLACSHFASVAWSVIAYRPEIARPLRLDLPDSFGRWFMVVTLAACSGTSFLIYQLRRYRNDDFKGHYRLWRLIVVLMLLASVNSLVSMIDWTGALLDASIGKRVALSGSDWMRLIISLGGAMLALRLVAEVRRCRSSLATMLIVCGLFSIPEAANWNVMQVDSLSRWALVTSAPMLGCTALFISLLAYLRMLYREVRQIEENDSLKQRFQQLRRRVLPGSSDQDEQEFDVDPPDASDSPKRWWRRKSSNSQASDAATDERDETERDETESDETKRGKTKADNNDRPSTQKDQTKKRRGWFRRRVAQDDSGATTETRKNSPPPKSSESSAPVKNNTKSGLGGWMRRGKPTEEPEEDPKTSQPAPAKPVTDSSKELNEEEIDWSSLSKSERRRLRKQLKRQNRAA